MEHWLASLFPCHRVEVEDSCCENALLTFEWMGGGISGARPRSRDRHGLLPDPGGEGHARLRLRRESWFR